MTQALDSPRELQPMVIHLRGCLLRAVHEMGRAEGRVAAGALPPPDLESWLEVLFTVEGLAIDPSLLERLLAAYRAGWASAYPQVLVPSGAHD